jgi:hypothetical protein
MDELLTKLSELSIGNQQSTKSSQAIESLLSVLLSSSFVDWCVDGASLATTDLLCLPDKILKKIAFIFVENKNLGLFDNLAEVGNQSLAF